MDQGLLLSEFVNSRAGKYSKSLRISTAGDVLDACPGSRPTPQTNFQREFRQSGRAPDNMNHAIDDLEYPGEAAHRACVFRLTG
ncbi:MAG: hypothetical protein DMG57_28820 [Acidobacteria bacterium]|nr:MAG: hypothetical protein DMG57_28820 [Acidobacteriota bacterium]